jgi:hypothetical protein
MDTANQSIAQDIGQPTLLSSVMSKLSCIEPSRAFLTGILVAAGIAAAVVVPAWADTGSASDPQSAALEKWRAVMAENPPQEAGCFHDSYPNLVHEKVDCSAGPPQRVHSMHRASTDDSQELVGSTTDYVAETTGKTFWAGGSFLDVSVQSVASVGVAAFNWNGILGPNEYTLQLNTNKWGTTSACDGHPGCSVWQQFVYSTDCDLSGCDPAGVFMQFWLLNYGACPGGWHQGRTSGDCYINSKVVGAPDFPITDLGNLSLHAAVQAGGQDCVAVYDNTGAGWGVCASDGVLDISSVWDKTEFGIFGDAGGSQAQFGFGTRFTQLLQVNDGSGAAPTCLKDAGTTGETNNLNLSKNCQVLVGNGLYPRIRFTEANPFSAPLPPNVCGAIFQGQGLTPGQSWQSCDGRFTLAMQTDSNLVLYEDGVALWNTGTVGQDVAWVTMQADGNLVLYNTSQGAVWNSHTSGYEGSSLAIQNDGNLVIYYKGSAIWDSNTCCH